ncbi:hypothetical protein ACFP2T_44475 [Plantactinospora solaniradicis]|uniref:Uncharacterized protein n=2 Tax=Plantactinospora solaniradicis TaxID=1723736 RepID=A0ABW1KP17_9ACTN
MVTEEARYISRDEVEAFVRKMEEWSGRLDDREKILLQAMLTPPETIQGVVPAEKEGFEFSQFTIGVPLESLLCRFRQEETVDKRLYIKSAGPSWVRFIQRRPPVA